MKSLLPLLILTVSCASAVSGTRETIVVDSTPQAASATLFCGATRVGDALTPAKFNIQRNAGDCTVRVSKTGFLDASAAIEQGVNPVYWANFITLPVVQGGAFAAGWGAPALGAGLIVVGAAGWIVDHRTGAIHRHRPNRISLSLRKESE